MLPRLIAFAVTSGLAKKAWDHYRDGRKRAPLQDITEVVARPAAVQPARATAGRKPATGRKSGGPGA
ncbi:MAG TPA: hypothetical protein VIL30_07250 [Ramlibacter sp.]